MQDNINNGDKMIVRIPKSLYDYLSDQMALKGHINKEAKGNSSVVFRGPYGEYKIVSIPDDELTVEKLEPVRRYKDDEK